MVDYTVEPRNYGREMAHQQNDRFDYAIVANGNGGWRLAGLVTEECARALKPILQAEADRRFGQPHHGHHE